MFTKLRNNISQMQMIALGFFCIILIGTLLLMTPLASRAGTWTDFLTALFTSTSATCVTGLVVTNTYLHWSLFGHHYYSDPDWRTWFYYLWIRIFHVLAKEDHLAATRTLKGKCQCRKHRRHCSSGTVDFTGYLTF